MGVQERVLGDLGAARGSPSSVHLPGVKGHRLFFRGAFLGVPEGFLAGGLPRGRFLLISWARPGMDVSPACAVIADGVDTEELSFMVDWFGQRETVFYGRRFRQKGTFFYGRQSKRGGTVFNGRQFEMGPRLTRR